MSVKLSCCGCRVLLNEEEVYKLARVSGIAICDRCAKKVSDSYDEWHSGGRAAFPKPKFARKKISAPVILKIFKRDGYRCRVCGTNEDLTIDHIQPVSKGGTSEDENLQTLCRSCNSRKGAA
ncbi:HNH endonuclease [Salmonella enterica]|nr:HNH endonuclease [Salmonella enterica]EDS7046654.1 HNH endonuclease [Salmonella enterica subsp. enterica]EDV3448802.1 HNH endonuclease [Salmonella enterica subsp. enterica]EDV9393408.1 HNH endonuclease [Salmonella enterica subsp. enterica]MBH0741958.1 HNH endonuclease [Salmonella enterica]